MKENRATVAERIQLKVADEVWIATALFHRERPDRADFSIDEIVQRAHQEALHTPQRPGLYVHVVQHCVANRPPNPGRYRMLFETVNGRRRLFRKGDSYHLEREGGKITPNRDDIPAQYANLLNWYEDWASKGGEKAITDDPLLALHGSGKQLWADEHADDYVRRLREGWE
jgi:hypothetical protein